MKRKILILGGTQFVGRLLSERLQAREDLEITLFNRGKTHPELFPRFNKIQAERNELPIHPLCQQAWDIILDFSGYYPQNLSNFLQALKYQPTRYIFISSISVYDLESFKAGHPIQAQDPTLSCSPEEETDTQLQSYGKRKAACERVLLNTPNLHSLIFRPGLIYGPYDPTDRAYYWLWRIQQGRKILVPDTLEIRQHWTFAPDFASLLEEALEPKLFQEKIYLPLTHEPLSFAEMLSQMSAKPNQTSNWVKISEAEMQKYALNYWQDLPLTLPFERTFERQALLRDFKTEFHSFHSSFQLSSSYYDALNWPQPRTGLSPERENEIIAELHTESK
ncbi:hypothetical protein COW36_11050 [bacterium (Candidatus Blackallbacteria) CG17_big_fil_post_rev_8_21_14_2_50_48_46]|uniref:UDP-glucose 4-epimerase n=1 Tax=bacterium (Candidatus Blackallbacteria) CG17_big_fil_post_rev_8_21_14_2_50_48_46 TaxID=2014261 RepID=A0A2M7G4H2_9BACT|nr:MAG: hypothetical protein COW64_18145 [bacterium (Candidatus Blackallbacteria) CG18_big_fil_WC_8_21_14_2_50_49_26]PIW16812.1 MAG: hypothetical protein COW36_11050 [bacterium (Candidatus Blackallbacteria) CG17_big_fil_post_rev_8_21_14_2_50_48_46]PIW48009.1 MAG: hypothetical protein COW20_10765 [bacterium (Candidatus Blackallbacteria) CG13_big_fil_rev_8_21_14_2_50_49_14]